MTRGHYTTWQPAPGDWDNVIERIAAAEAYLAGLGLVRVRLISLAANTGAVAVWEHLGYRAYEITYEKPLDRKPR